MRLQEQNFFEGGEGADIFFFKYIIIMGWGVYEENFKHI